MKTHFLMTGAISAFLFGGVFSCTQDKQSTRTEQKDNSTKKRISVTKSEKEHASFDKLPNHNDSVVGCWLIDKTKSIRLRDDEDIDALFFLEENKELSMFIGSKNSEVEQKIGFFRFYNNELTLEITQATKPFKYKWRTTINGEKMVAESKQSPGHFLYLTKIDKESGLL